MALLRRLLVPLIFFVGQYLYARLKFFGAFRFSTQPISHYVPTGNYFAIPEIVLAEDVAVHKPFGQLILFGQTEFRQRTGWWPAWAVFDRVEDGMSARGKLWSVDPKSLKPSEIKLVDFDEPFTNHGIDIYPSPSDDNVFYLHAINHPPEVIDGKPTDQASSRIEVFIVNIKTREAKHQRSVHHPLIKRPNDIYSISPTEFLVTNDHHNSRGLLRLLEDFITLSIASWTDVVHVKFDSKHPEHASSAKGTQQKPFLDTAAGVTAKLVATRLHNANGLARGPGNNEVIVADASGGHMTSFVWNAATETLDDKRGILTDLPIDNPVYFDDPYATPASNASGYVIAGLLSGIHLDKQSRDPEARIPSSLWLAKETEGGGIKKHLLFEDDGNFVSGAATAVLLPIDPATLKGTKDEGKRLGWAVITGPWSRQAGAVKVDLTEWTKV